MTPGRLGELAKWAYLHARGAGAGRAAAGVLLDRLFDVGATALGAMVLLVWASTTGTGPPGLNTETWARTFSTMARSRMFSVLLGALAIAVLAGTAWKILRGSRERRGDGPGGSVRDTRRPGDVGPESAHRRPRMIVGSLWLSVPARIRGAVPEGAVSDFRRAMVAVRGRSLVAVSTLTFGIWTMNLVVSFFLVRSVAPLAPFPEFALAWGAAGVASYAPVSISGTGARELIFLGILPAVGVTPVEIVAYGVLEVAFVSVVTAILALVFGLAGGRRLLSNFGVAGPAPGSR